MGTTFMIKFVESALKSMNVSLAVRQTKGLNGLASHAL
jgi:hypothetical protein